jgi:hypothetical protein
MRRPLMTFEALPFAQNDALPVAHRKDGMPLTHLLLQPYTHTHTHTCSITPSHIFRNLQARKAATS